MHWENFERLGRQHYPEWRAGRNYQNLKEVLNQVESEILDARRGYHVAVRCYNTHVQSFPSNLMAVMFHQHRGILRVGAGNPARNPKN